MGVYTGNALSMWQQQQAYRAEIAARVVYDAKMELKNIPPKESPEPAVKRITKLLAK